MSKVSKTCICAFEKLLYINKVFFVKNIYLENLTCETNTQRDKHIHMFNNLWLTFLIWNLTKVDMFIRETKKNKAQEYYIANIESWTF